MNIKTKAHINSLDGKMDDITVLEDKGNNHYIVDYRGVKCTAIFNFFYLHLLRRRYLRENRTMSNIQKLAANGNKNHRLFAATIVDLMNSQGFYGRLYRAVNEMDDTDYKALYNQLANQHFNDTLDVVLWLEC